MMDAVLARIDLTYAQVIVLTLSAPLCLALGAYMVLHRPMAKPKLWYSLAGLVIVVSLVSLRDAQLIKQLDVESPAWAMVRYSKFVFLAACLWFALKEPDADDNGWKPKTESDYRGVRQDERSGRQDRREIRQDKREDALDVRDVNGLP